MDNYLFDRLEIMLITYKRMLKDAQEEQNKYMVPSSEFEGAKKVDLTNHNKWAAAVMKESIAMFVVADIETLLKDYFAHQQRQLEEFRLSLEGK